MAPPQGPQAFEVTSEAFQVRATIDLEAVESRLLNEARRLFTDFSQQGLAGEALADAVDAGLAELSDALLTRSGRSATTEAFNLGRNLAAQRNARTVGRAVRTEILDTETCDPCREFDGRAVTMNTPEYFELMPPNGCDGRELCRGFYIYEAA